MRGLVLSFAAIVTANMSQPASAYNWFVIGTATDNTVVLIDLSSVRDLPSIDTYRPFPVWQAWFELNYARVKTEKHRSEKWLRRFNCEAETGMIVSSTSYNPNGSVAKSYSQEDFDFKYEPVTPDTIGFAMMEYACGRKGPAGAPY